MNQFNVLYQKRTKKKNILMTVNTDSLNKPNINFTIELSPLSYTTGFNFDNTKITETYAFAPRQYTVNISNYWGEGPINFSKMSFYLKAADDITRMAIDTGCLILPEKTIITPEATGSLGFGNIAISGKAPENTHLEIGLYEYSDN